MNDHSLDSAALMAMLTSQAAMRLGDIAAGHSNEIAALREFEPIKTAATFAGLLTNPNLQSSCLRLEALVHLSLSAARETRKPHDKLVGRLFASVGDGVCGHIEDPAEDVFVCSVATPRGNFRVLGGVWESAGFFLQLFMNIVEGMPQGHGFDGLREAAYALLSLSDLLCERAHLMRYDLGNPVREKVLTHKNSGSLSTARRLVRFSEMDLRERSISLEGLEQFVFDPQSRDALFKETLGHTQLEKCPLIRHEGDYYLMLPTAVSSAIRRYIIERVDASGLRQVFLRALAQEYTKLFANTPLLGSHFGAPIKFMRTANGMFGGAFTSVERGRYLSFVFVLDTLEDFGTAGLVGQNPDPMAKAEDIEKWIASAYESAKAQPDFRDGATLVVGCGIGRSSVFAFGGPEHANWRVETISGADLHTLSWVPDFKPSSLWRLLEAKDKLASLGVRLSNANGLLNIVQWARSLGGHLIPHDDMPDHFVEEGRHATVMIQQNSLRDLRHEVAIDGDPHVELDTRGRWVNVRKANESLFEEDCSRPFYASLDKPEGKAFPSVYVTSARPWWCEIEFSGNTSDHFQYERWRMVTAWLCRAVPVLEDELPGLPDGPILWCAVFEGAIGDTKEMTAGVEYDETRNSLSAGADIDAHSVTIRATARYELGHFNVDNVAERALVDALVEGAAKLAATTLSESERQRIVNRIVPDTRARQTHIFRARRFRDFVHESLSAPPILTDKDDAASVKLGLGWRVRAKSDGAFIRGKADCLDYLSKLVRVLEDEVCDELRSFDRSATVRAFLTNHESAAVDRDRWERTSAAMLSLRKDRRAAQETIVEHGLELNGVFQASRLLVEIALCECPLSGGIEPARSDMSRLMTKTMLIVHFGGWSDAMRWDAMEPLIKVTPLGDVHANLGFVDGILSPFAHAAGGQRIRESVDDYAENLEDITYRESVEEKIDLQFLAAWLEEIGASLDDARLMIDFLENMGAEKGEAILELRRSDLVAIGTKEKTLAASAAEALVERFTLKSRPHWRDVPEGYDDSDRQPWRFRRRLSVLRRPLFQIDETEDPTILVAPGLLREAFVYMVGHYHRGDFPPRQLKPKMRSWAGKQRDRVGSQFSHDVAAKLREFGWKAEAEVKITKLLRQGFDRDYGDVDVLAWNPGSGRVLVIECKDVQYRKTYGEIAEQLADFRGELRADGKPDYLRKHLDRMDIIRRHLPAVAAYIGADRVEHAESHLVFRNPVPMEFALGHMAKQVSVGTFDRLATI